jgi:UDP-glucose 4-epimerase
MHTLITGGAGFIGSHLADALVQRGDTVIALDNLSTGRIENLAGLVGHPRFRFVQGDVCDEADMGRPVSECEVIVHLAAAVGVELVVSDPVRTLETNLGGTETVLRLARRYGRKVLLASTSEVYGKSTDIPFREDGDRVMGPTSKSRWSYAESKAIDEFMGLAYHAQFGVPVVIARFFNTVGPRQTGMYGMVIPRFVQAALRGEPLPVHGDGTQSRCFCNVQDTVRAVMALMAEPRAVGEVYNIGSQEEITIRALAERVMARTGSRSEIQVIPYERAYAKGFEDMHRRVPSLAKIKAALGWEPGILLDQTLDEVAAHFRGK